MGTYDTRGGHPLSPPGYDYGPSELVEAVLLLLEKADIDTETNDKITKLIEDAEAVRNQGGDPPEFSAT